MTNECKHTISFKVTADDFGYCKERNKGILETIRNGVVNSVSVLINGSDTVAIDSNIKVGLHLNLTEGLPVSPAVTVKSLLGDDKMMLGKFGFRNSLTTGIVSTEEIHLEMENQIDQFIQRYKKLPDHVDGHQHVHVLPGVSTVFASVLKKYGVLETRIPFEISLNNRCSWIDKPCLKFYNEVCDQALLATAIFVQHGLVFPSYFIGLTTMSCNLNESNLSNALDCIKEDLKSLSTQQIHVIELMTHPGFPSSDDGGCGSGTDQFSRSNDRRHEVEQLTSEWIKTLIKDFILSFE